MVELCVALGACVGLLTTIESSSHKPCPHGVRAGTSHCLAWVTSHTVGTYVVHALTGGLLGLAFAVCLLLAWQSTKGAAREDARLGRQPIPERVRHEVWRRDLGQCVDCASRERLEFDHIIPLSQGGSSTARNLELRCEGCNRRKGARI